MPPRELPLRLVAANGLDGPEADSRLSRQLRQRLAGRVALADVGLQPFAAELALDGNVLVVEAAFPAARRRG